MDRGAPRAGDPHVPAILAAGGDPYGVSFHDVNERVISAVTLCVAFHANGRREILGGAAQGAISAAVPV